MATPFKTPINNVHTTVAGGGYTAGAGQITVAVGTGSAFGSPSSGNPIRITVVTQATYRSIAETLTIFSCTGRSSDTLTGLTVIEGTTDRNYATNDIVEMRWTAQAASDIHTAVNNIENAYATDSTVVHLAGTETVTGAKTFSTVPTLGSLTGILKAASGTVSAATGADIPVMTASGASHAAGAAPDPGVTAGTTHFLCENATWAVPPSFVASGASHAPGYVPDPGASAGTTKFLREDASWQVPAGGGTVTSVTFTGDGTVLSSTPSSPPVTTSGTVTASLITQTANTVLAGPATGSAANPTFRGLVPIDYPTFVASGASHAKGAVPDPGATAVSADKANYLREDATWVNPLTIGAPIAGSNWNRLLYTDAQGAVGHLTAAAAVPFDIVVDATGSSTTTPRTIGAGNVPSGQAMQFQFDPYQCWRTGGNCNQQLIAYFGIELYGRSTSKPSFTVSTTTPTGSPHVTVFGVNAADTGLAVVGATSQTGALQTWMTNSTTTVASVNKDGVYKGAQAHAYTAKSTTYQALVTDGFIACTAASTWVLTLPVAANVPSGFELVIKKIDAGGGAITVTASGSDTIEGSATYSVAATQYKYVRIVSDGSANWLITGSN